MQSVIRINKNIHPILDDIDRMYELTSEHATESLIPPVFDTSFEELFDVFDDYGDELYEVDYADIYRPYKDKLKLSKYDKNNIILAFSGGKDSVADAILYKEMGKNVYLYYLKHINSSFSDEWECAQKCADFLGLPLYIDDIRFKGHHIWMEHPMKNMLIANGALSYGIREGIGTKIAFGNYTSSYLFGNPFEKCAGDCIDMWEKYEHIISNIIPDFKIDVQLENLGHTLEIITKPEYQVALENSLSCMCRHSLRPYRHQWVKDKFGIDLLSHRCGSCFKCCVEYIYMADHDLIEFSEAYYKYCLSQLFKVAVSEGHRVFRMEYLWATFMFYPIEKSKLYDQFDGVELLLSEMRWKTKQEQ